MQARRFAHQYARQYLPGGTHGINAELPCVAGPARCAVEASTRGWFGSVSVLMINWCHRVLRNAPRIILLHTDGRGHNDSRWLPVGHVVVLSMPWSARSLRLSPSITFGRHGEIENSLDRSLSNSSGLSRCTHDAEATYEQCVFQYKLGHLMILCCARQRKPRDSEFKLLVRVVPVKTT